MKKTISLLLALLLMAGTLLSCSEGTNENAPDAQAPAADDGSVNTPEETETELARANYPDSLPELDFGGADVIVHSRGDDSPTEVVSEEMTGEAVNDAIYERHPFVHHGGGRGV